MRIVIEHIARHSGSAESRRRIGESVQEVIAPFTLDRSLHIEFHVDETSQDFWMIDGLWPPPAGSAGVHLWREQNHTTALIPREPKESPA